MKIVKVNVDHNQKTARNYATYAAFPTLMIFKNGKVEATEMGAVSQNQADPADRPHHLIRALQSRPRCRAVRGRKETSSLFAHALRLNLHSANLAASCCGGAAPHPFRFTP